MTGSLETPRRVRRKRLGLATAWDRLVGRTQGIAFIALGALNTLIGFVWFVSFELVVGPHAGYLVVLLMAHMASVTCAFVLYRRLLFRVRGQWWKDLLRFESVYLAALGLNLLLLPILVEIIGLPVITAQTLVVMFTAALSFFGHKHFSFRRPRTADRDR
jgi:putative flippase GtrA